ncbi:YitT family protein [Bacteroidales bacterium OttesenSCG-928-B11]|nr:YitT family protein [Bacteroidales bacterium OttesenSCG-928-C03]MDL2312094.1 YitT family protein [Bacteroidales bacterium OttesenSCG-928-B11]MDL2326064.1 YitT family protein [Bacteroidales bacterium OttesenSCG-928-A14]
MASIQDFKEAFSLKGKKMNPKELAKEYAMILFGALLMAIGFVVFVSPLKLAPGGVYGIAIILHHLFGFPIGLSGITLEIPLFIIGTLWLGPKFGLKTIVGIISLSGFISLLEHFYGYDPLIADPSAQFLIALFGGVFIGLGLGLVFKSRATSGGTDIIAMIVSKYFKHLPIGTVLICVDSFVVLFALIAFKDWSVPLYSLLVIYMTGVVADKVMAGFASAKVVMIVSDKHEEIAIRIMNNLKRGGTYLKGEGMYSHAEKKIIYVSVSRKQLPQLIYFAHEIDPRAFVSILDASSTLGEGFESLEEKALS